MGSTPSPPTPPDPVATASAQGASNVSVAAAQTQLNNINQITPWGSLTYSQTGQGSTTNPDGTVNTFPTWTSTQALSPDQQDLYNQQIYLASQSNDAAGQGLWAINQSLNGPITSANLPSLTTSIGAPSLASGYDAGGAIQSGYDPGGTIQSGYASGGAIQNGYASGGDIAHSYDPGGSVQSDVNLNTNAPTTFGQTRGQVQYGLGNTDFTADRDAATNAALQRLAPTMAAQGEALNASLANQGVAQGSAAWNAAQLSQNQVNNDLRLGAVQTGDAEQQALYGERLSTGQFNNAAQQQDYSQLLGRGQFAQAGIAQNNAATLAAGQFHNAAQGQQNQENAAAAAFGNSAQLQAEQENAARAAFGNAAQGQAESENAARAAFGNAAQAQQNQQNQSGAAFSNAAQAQQNSQNQQAAAFGNTAAQGLFGMNQAAATFGNQAREQSLTDQETLNNNAINQVSSLMHGGQVTTGQYQGYTPGQIGQTPISQDTYASANLAEQSWETQAKLDAQNNAQMFSALGGLFGMGTRGMSGGFA